jgi:methionine synthase I (cobalamin-dependent)
MSTLLDTLCSGRVLLMDGAMGTELQKLGLCPNENGAAWNLLHPEHVRAVHQAYRDAGAEVFLSNTLMANAANLTDTMREHGRIPFYHHEVWTKDYELMGPPDAAIFRLAVHGPVAGPIAVREFDKWGYFYTSSFIYEGADAVLLETCSSPRVRYAIRRIRPSGNSPPILLSLSYQHDNAGRLVTHSGHAPEWFAERAAAWGIAALGVNCGREIDMDDVIEITKRYRSVTDLPLFARPNAGTPTHVDKRWVYPRTTEEMAARLPELLEAGIAMVGGCCGTTPEHIAAMRLVVNEWNSRRGHPHLGCRNGGSR